MIVEVVSIDGSIKLKNVHSDPERPKRRNPSFDGISLVLKLCIKYKTQWLLLHCVFMH